MGIFGDSLEKRGQTTVGLLKMAIYSVLSLLISSEALEVRPTLLYTINRGYIVLPGNFEQKLE